MNSQNVNLTRLKRELNKSINVNMLYKNRVKKLTNVKQINKPKYINKTPKYINKTPKYINKIPRYINKTQRNIGKYTNNSPINIPKYIKSSNSSNTNSTVWTFFYIILTVSILFFIALLLFNLYKEYIYSLSEQTNDINIDNQITKAPKGVIDKEGAPISVETSGNITENKYLTLYGGDDFMKKNFNSLPTNSPYSSYPNSYSGYNGNNADNGVTKIYYENNMTDDNKKLNNYIEKQNNYIKNINKRVHQINSNRMYTPEYIQDKESLSHIRNYERLLANKVSQEYKNQPYLQEIVNY